MPRKSITDQEFGLIKAMLRRSQRFNDRQIVRGIRSLPDGFEPTQPLFDLLRGFYRDSGDNANVRSGVFSAAARLDELERTEQPK
jgi:hypothetical protein